MVGAVDDFVVSEGFGTAFAVGVQCAGEGECVFFGPFLGGTGGKGDTGGLRGGE